MSTASSTPTTATMILSQDDVDRVRQWFDAVQDLSPEYLEPADFQLAQAIYKLLGMRVPLSIERRLP